MLLTIGALTGCKTSDTVVQSPATRFAVKAVRIGDRLVVLDSDSDLWTIRPNDATAERLVVASGEAVDLCTTANATRLHALVKLDEVLFRVDEWTGARWEEGIPLSLDSHPEDTRYRSPPRLACDHDIYVMTPDQLLILRQDKAQHLRLAPAIEPDFADYHLLPLAGALWVGVDAGEWGGAVRRIDLRTGEVQTVSSEIWPGICSGPLSVDCDSVFALAPSPWHEDCAVAAVGSLHISVKGRLLEICDRRVARLYFKRLDDDEMWEWIKRDRMYGGEPALTVGFYGFAQYRDELVALGYDGIYRFRTPATPRISPLPKPANIGGFGIAEVIPGLYLVQSRPPETWPGKGPVYNGTQYLLVDAR